MLTTWTSAAEIPVLRVYLPRTARAASETLTLGELAILRCEDEQKLAAASAIPMGRCPQPKEKLVIDRNTVLVRLASAGLRGKGVVITGAAEMVVQRDEKAVPAEDITQAAQTLLQDNKAAAPNSHLELVGPVEDLLVSASASVTLQARPLAGGPPNQVRVRVTACDGARELGARDVIYKRVYTVRQAILTQDLQAGMPFSEANLRVRSVTSDRPQEPDWAPPLGQVASTPLKAGTVLTPGQAKAAQLAAAIRKNQAVTMRIQGAGFTLTGLGTALQDGKSGECIKVRNNDSQRIVTARVAADGCVEPIMEEVVK